MREQDVHYISEIWMGSAESVLPEFLQLVHQERHNSINRAAAPVFYSALGPDLHKFIKVGALPSDPLTFMAAWSLH